MEFKILLDFYLSLTHVIYLILSHREAIYSNFLPLPIRLNRMCSMFLPHDYENGTLPFENVLISFPYWVGYDIIYFKPLKWLKQNNFYTWSIQESIERISSILNSFSPGLLNL